MTAGLIVAGVAVLLSGYEFVALVSSRLPTISRVIQGWRDRGAGWQVAALVVSMVTALGVFAAWLYHHLLYERRSDL